MTEPPATKSVKKAIADSKKRFVTVSEERISKAAVILEEIENGVADQTKIENLSRFYHQLAGAAGLYEMTEFCSRAIAAEDLSMQLKELTGTSFTSTVKQLKNLTENLKQLMAAQGQDDADSANQDTSQYTQQSTSGRYSALGSSVLVVASDPTSSSNLKGIMDTLGVRMQGCQNFQQAEAAIKEQTPDGLIICTPINGGSPLELAYQVRAQPNAMDVPIVFIGDEDNFLDKVKAIKAGCDAFWDKSATVQQIEDKARRTFARLLPHKYKILLVEDDPIQASTMYQFLEAAGFEPFVMTDAEQFEEALLSSQPDLILLDVILGEITGFELARYVRQNEKFSTTPIIFLTTQNALNFHIQGAKLGDDYLIKPAPPQLLIATIAGRLERYKTIQDLMGRDALTGTLTYAEFMKEADRVIGRADTDSSFLLIDVDGLAKINETQGFAAGERVIATLAELLKKTIRNFGVIGRLSGDEFGVLFDALSDNQLLEIATYLKTELKATAFQGSEGDFRASITCGIARFKEEDGLNDWIQSAYDAVRIAKMHGADSVGID